MENVIRNTIEDEMEFNIIKHVLNPNVVNIVGNNNGSDNIACNTSKANESIVFKDFENVENDIFQLKYRMD